MKITCKNKECGTIINIPDEKIPDKPVKIACPKCKSPNILNPAGGGEEGTSRQEIAREGNNLEQSIMSKVEQRLASLRNELLGQIQYAAQASPSAGSFAAPAAGDMAPAAGMAVKKALICDDDKMVRKIINDNVSALGYEATEVETVDEALKILDNPELNYGLIIIDKVFPGDAEGGHKILSKIATMQIDARRKIFVVFISGDVKSGDPTAAFLSGANIMLNKQDLDKLSAIIENEMADYDKLYRTFKKCMETSRSVRRD